MFRIWDSQMQETLIGLVKVPDKAIEQLQPLFRRIATYPCKFLHTQFKCYHVLEANFTITTLLQCLIFIVRLILNDSRYHKIIKM